MEFKNLLKERMSDPIVMRYITNITANAKKNDAKTAAELEAFRKELGIWNSFWTAGVLCIIVHVNTLFELYGGIN